MEIKFALSGKLGFAPQITAILNSIDEAICAHNHYSLRHPADIFHFALSDVVRDFLALLEVIEPLEQKTQSEMPELSEQSVKLFKELLAGFSRYIDCTYEVIVALSDERDRPNPGKFLRVWLKEQGYKAGNLYYSIIKRDVDFFTKLNDQLKHSSNSLKPVTVLINSQPCLGYFLEAADSNGILGPSELFHKGSAGTRTANSFNRDLRLLYHSVYSAADALKRAVEYHLKEVHNSDRTENSERQYDDVFCKNLFDSLSRLPQVFYSSEAGKTVPIAHVEEQKIRRLLIFTPIKAPILYGTLRTSSGGTIGRGGRFQVPFP